MRSIDLRIPLLAGAAIVLLAVSPARADTGAQEVQFVPGTGEPVATEALPFTDDRADTGDAQADLLEMADKLSDPRMQDDVADMVGSMTEKMMDFPIGKFAVAMERAIPGAMRDKSGRRVRANDTVADLAGRDADHLSDDLAKGSRQMMGMMSGFAAAFATMLPEFEKLGEEMEKSFDNIKDANRDYD